MFLKSCNSSPSSEPPDMGSQSILNFSWRQTKLYKWIFCTMNAIKTRFCKCCVWPPWPFLGWSVQKTSRVQEWAGHSAWLPRSRVLLCASCLLSRRGGSSWGRASELKGPPVENLYFLPAGFTCFTLKVFIIRLEKNSTLVFVEAWKARDPRTTKQASGITELWQMLWNLGLPEKLLRVLIWPRVANEQGISLPFLALVCWIQQCKMHMIRNGRVQVKM